jgi:hypothetical protein
LSPIPDHMISIDQLIVVSQKKCNAILSRLKGRRSPTNTYLNVFDGVH